MTGSNGVGFCPRGLPPPKLRSSTIGLVDYPRWLSRVLLALAVVLAPWIILLLIFNPPAGTAVHVRLAGVGLSGAAAASAAIAAAGVLRGARWMLPASTVCLTLLAFGTMARLVLAHPSSTTLMGVTFPVVVAVPGIIAALVVIRRLSRRRAEDLFSWRLGVAGTLLLVAIALVASAVLAAIYDTSPVPIDHTRSVWVLLDIAELLALARTAQALEGGDARATLVAGAVSATLLLTDAWVNTVLVPGGHALLSATFYDIVGELPSAFLSGWAALIAFRALSEDASLRH